MAATSSAIGWWQGIDDAMPWRLYYGGQRHHAHVRGAGQRGACARDRMDAPKHRRTSAARTPRLRRWRAHARQQPSLAGRLVRREHAIATASIDIIGHGERALGGGARPDYGLHIDTIVAEWRATLDALRPCPRSTGRASAIAAYRSAPYSGCRSSPLNRASAPAHSGCRPARRSGYRDRHRTSHRWSATHPPCDVRCCS